MGYFARVNNGVVEQVISASQDFIDSMFHQILMSG